MNHVIARGALAFAAVAAIAVASIVRADSPAQAGAAADAARSAPPAVSPAPSDRLSYGRFNNLSIYSPAGPPKSFVLLLSGADGWDSRVAALARKLSGDGAMVAGIDLPKLDANLEADDGDCVFLDGDLENLSHFLQAYYHVSTYLPPFLVGYRAGAVLAYAALAQAPADTFAGALSVGFSPVSTLRKPLCKSSALEWSRVDGRASEIRYHAAKRLGAPWVLFQAERDQVSSAREAGQFIAGMQGAALVGLGGVGGDYTPLDAWAPRLLAAFNSLVARTAAETLPAAPTALGDLPIVEVPAQPGLPATDTFAIIMSGDGGWAGLDKAVAEALSAHGIPVIGLDSLRYFWSARTAEGLARDTDHMIRYYLAHLKKKRVLLIGYSQGADVLPFAVNRLPQATRSTVALAVLMGMSEHALFEFHVSSWISNDMTGPETLPEVNRISGVSVLCIYGDGDKDSLCPKLDPARIQVVKLPGGHHFNGDYAGLAKVILATANR
ncbi:MAG TPA: AcvB/VirJ family lysyl-phosphatidylglycerol hydrolase [Steroidobacteraceae bacterium]|nr:AcvB/VirJ family lysyl-phosphatidylglycerol hydrolase [Steroidobacteraceae bacterium]